jgi:hypothetical protein
VDLPLNFHIHAHDEESEWIRSQVFFHIFYGFHECIAFEDVVAVAALSGVNPLVVIQVNLYETVFLHFLVRQ